MRLLLCLTLVGSVAAAAAPPVDLDAPGALESLRTANPAHYEKVQAIMVMAQARPTGPLHEWLRTHFDATQVSAPPLWHTSNPPQRRLAFTLDDTRYVATVVGRLQRLSR